MSVVNTDSISYQSKTLENFLETAKRKKNMKYLNSFLNQRRHFTPFVASVDGLLGVEAEETLKLIASRLAQKWQEPYSRTFGYMNSRLAITILRATHRCIRGGGVTAYRISVTHPQWEDGECLHLFW